MLKRITSLAIAGAFFLAMGYADQSKGKIVIPVGRTNPTDGKLMYQSYCAPCHGVDGRGNGPAASAMKTQPVDLTQLARIHQGKFPENHIAAVLQFGTAVSAHGSASMPVWGQLFGKIEPVQSQETALRINNLTHYLETMQAR
ncbi:MAG TPA: c-type cytochrome [Terracidiphilus sp.]|jgi:mono/diheme cytochrome c family protein|nr:c-type cytochrome [Terracidiphilus sp.]